MIICSGMILKETEVVQHIFNGFETKVKQSFVAGIGESFTWLRDILATKCPSS